MAICYYMFNLDNIFKMFIKPLRTIITKQNRNILKCALCGKMSITENNELIASVDDYGAINHCYCISCFIKIGAKLNKEYFNEKMLSKYKHRKNNSTL